MKVSSDNITRLATGATIGFSIFWLASHPKSKIHKKLPNKKYKNVSLLPSVKYYGNDKVYHLHHWLILSVIYIPFVLFKRLRKFPEFHGLFLGSIIQGLLYKDRFKIRY